MDHKTVDWFRLITDLKRAGFGAFQQAKEVGVTRRTIDNWSNDIGEPSYSKGLKLIDIYKSVISST